jgi:hypothetical protein
MKTKKVYYRVQALQDGTITIAMPERKPRKTRSSDPQIDEDGIFFWGWHEEKDDEPSRFTDWAKGVCYTCVATALNVKRIVRQQVEARLDVQQQEIASIHEQLTRIEEKLDRLLDAAERPQNADGEI